MRVMEGVPVGKGEESLWVFGGGSSCFEGAV